MRNFQYQDHLKGTKHKKKLLAQGTTPKLLPVTGNEPTYSIPEAIQSFYEKIQRVARSKFAPNKWMSSSLSPASSYHIGAAAGPETSLHETGSAAQTQGYQPMVPPSIASSSSSSSTNLSVLGDPGTSLHGIGFFIVSEDDDEDSKSLNTEEVGVTIPDDTFVPNNDNNNK